MHSVVVDFAEAIAPVWKGNNREVHHRMSIQFGEELGK